MGSNIWYISKYAVTPQYGNPTRQYFLSKYLAREGHKVSLIYSRSSMFATPPPRISEPITSRFEGFRQVMLPGPLVSLGFSLKRVWSWLFFERKVRKWARKQAEFPDVIIVSSLSILTFLTGIALKSKYDCKLVVEVRDIYPFTLTALGKFKPHHPAIRYLSKVETESYKAADLIVSTLDYFEDHLNKVFPDGLNKYQFIPMGFDPEYFQKENIIASSFDMLANHSFVVGYAGSFSTTQATDVMFEAIKKMANDLGIHFVLAGDGVEKAAGLAKIRGLHNYTDLGRIDKNQVPIMLEYCDVVLNPWLDLKVYEYGISPNKWMDYMYAAKPIIISYAGKSKLIQQAACGSIIAPEDTDALVDEIYRFKNMPSTQRAKIGDNGRRYLEDNLNYQKHAKTLLAAITNN